MRRVRASFGDTVGVRQRDGKQWSRSYERSG